MKVFEYSDEKIIHNGRVYYLRCKFGRRGSQCVYTIRTHRNGKGRKIAQVKGIITDDKSAILLIHRLYKKKKFEYLVTLPIPSIPQ